MSQADPRQLSAALLWLLNHYEAGTHSNAQLRGRVISRIENVLHEHSSDISIADMMAFRKAFRHGRQQREGEENGG